MLIKNNNKLWGVVLAGGLGKRIGGGKSWCKINGRRFIDLALIALRQVCSQIMIVTNTVDLVAYINLANLVIDDLWPGQGPLNGIVSGFLGSGATGILVIGVDYPLVRVDLLKVLAQGHGYDIAVAPIGSHNLPEPLLAYYSRDCLSIALSIFRSGERRPYMLLKAVKTRILTKEQVEIVDPEGLSFLNINSYNELILLNNTLAKRDSFVLF